MDFTYCSFCSHFACNSGPVAGVHASLLDWGYNKRGMSELLAAVDPATRFTVMPPPSAKLCRHLVQSYAATRLDSQNIIHAEGVIGKS